MENYEMLQISQKWLFLLLKSYLAFAFVMCSTKTTHIVQIDKWAKPALFVDHVQWYSSMLRSVTSQPNREDDTGDQDRILYTYHTAFHGMAAQLTREEVERLQEKQGVMAVYPETVYQLHTTRSPIFLGLQKKYGMNVWSNKVSQSDVVVGVLDTGIWPESPSFIDTGMRPVPNNSTSSSWYTRACIARALESRASRGRILLTRAARAARLARTSGGPHAFSATAQPNSLQSLLPITI